MKSLSPIIVSILLILGVSCQPTTSNTSLAIDIEKESPSVQKVIEEQWPAAYEDQDTVLLSQILHTTFRLVDDQGQIYKKSDEMAYVAQYGTSYDTYSFDISQLEVYSNGTAKVLGKGSIIGSDVDGSYSLSYQASYSLIKENGRWQVIHNHVSGVKEERF